MEVVSIEDAAIAKRFSTRNFKEITAGNTGYQLLDDLIAAIEQMEAEENPLISVGYRGSARRPASERASCHRIGFYLQNFLNDRGCDAMVDCEYNRAGDGPRASAKNVDGTRSIDLIVHSRGEKGPNYLSVEAKHSVFGIDSIFRDVTKLEKHAKKFQYHHMAYLIFDPTGTRVFWKPGSLNTTQVQGLL